MLLTLTPGLTLFVLFVTFIVGGLIGLLMGIRATWLCMWPRRSTPSVLSALPSVNGRVLGSKCLKPSNKYLRPFVVPHPPVWKNGRRLPPATGNLGRKPPNGS